MRVVQVAFAMAALAVSVGMFGQVATAATKAGAAGLIFSPAASTKFVNVPFLPQCMKISIKQGSPRAGSFVTLAKIATGCTIPWHWHTANVQLFFVSGLGLHQVGASHGPVEVRPGDFIYLPARTTHSFRCLSTCLAFNISDGPDIVHWVDRSGKALWQAQAFQLNEGP